MKRTTLLLILAALTASSCSLERNSQYGLRWDRRIYAPQRAANEIKVPEYGTEAYPTVRAESASASVEAAAFSVNPEVEALQVATIGPETQPDAVPAHMADAELTLDNFRKSEADVAPIADEALPIHPFAKKVGVFLLKSLLTLALVAAGLLLGLYTLIFIWLTDWTSWATVSGSGGWINLPSLGIPHGVLLILLSGGGVALCVVLVGRLWTSKSAPTN